VLVSGHDGQFGWLVAGTVTSDTLTHAVDDLYRGTVIVGDGR
jgi:hypothetical protein